MGGRPLWLLLLLAGPGPAAAAGWASQSIAGRNQSLQVNAFDFGIWHYALEDAAYRVRDVIVPFPDGAHDAEPAGPEGVYTLTHRALNGVVGASTLALTTAPPLTVGFSVDGVPALTMTIEDKAPETEAVGATFLFPGAPTLYGIPERAVDLALKAGTKYRLWNLDVFRYQLDDPKGIYGTIPFMMAHTIAPDGQSSRTVGLLWLNAGDTTVEIQARDGADGAPPGVAVTWVSLTGTLEVFLLPGPTPTDVLQQLSYLTGKPQLPPLFSLGYHQCRWNYRNEEDTLAVDEGFDTNDIPYDVIWLDIEHTDGKRYFTWDAVAFPNPEALQERIAAKGRKMVTITDPHIKRAAGYHVYDEAVSGGHFVKDAAGTADYEGNCWPGQSSWLDFLNPAVRQWYATLFLYDRYKGSTPILYSWIDMNEPSVFSGPEVTMEGDATHHGGVKHRAVHNLYGFYQMMATYEGQLLRSQGPPHDTPTRPFLLSRSFFAGSQRYGAVWTGDNAAQWSHLAKATPMLLAMSLSALTFVGADVGGFFDNPEDELLVRWYQAAAYTPFFRGHAHLETKRREPWLFGDENTRIIREAIRARYRLLPYLYTAFHTAAQEGLSVISPLFFRWPTDAVLPTYQDAFLVGDAVLVRPITAPHRETGGRADVYLPGGPQEGWFDFATGAPYAPGLTHTLTLDLDRLPVFQRAGTIVPLRQRARRSTTAMRNDPFTLQIAVGPQGTAAGFLYLDDAHSFKYQRGAYVHRRFSWRDNRLTSASFVSESPYATPPPPTEERFATTLAIERLRVYGLQAPPSEVYLEFDFAEDPGSALESIKARQQLTFSFDAGVLTVRKPMAGVASDWTITFAFA